MKLTIEDIEFGMYGFMVRKVKKLSDKKLTAIEDSLDEIHAVLYANIDDMGCLSVSWCNTQDLTEEEKKTVLRKLLEIINSK
jgi:hypothetical protein